MGIVLLRLLSAVVAIAALSALTSDLVDKASETRYTTPEVRGTEEPEGDDEPRRDGVPRYLVHEDDPTVYDAQGDLAECARTRPRVGTSSSVPGLDDDVRAISLRVARIRQLDFAGAVDTRLVSRSEVGRRFAQGYLRRYGEREAARDSQVLAAFRLVPEGTDLRELASRLLSRGVGGFYNPRNDRLFAGSTAGTLTPYDEMVLAHELDHALVDQVMGLPGTLSRNPMLSDTILARQALAEGDATLVMTRYADARFTRDDFDSFVARFSQRPVQPRADVPYVFARTSEFPYYEGLLFACAEWRARGWHAVNQMYGRPPVSTADVLFPSRYAADDESELPRPPASPGLSWGPEYVRAFGALDLMVLLENADLLSKGETVPGSHVDAVRGWDGGVLHYWVRGTETTVHLAFVDAGVETPEGRRRRLCGVMRRWVLETYPGATAARARIPKADAWRSEGDLALVRCEGSAVDFVKGPSAAAVRNVLGG